MPVTTQQKEEPQKLAIPQNDYEMWRRDDYFDQKRLRYNFANPLDIDIEQETIKTEDETVVDPNTIELPTGPAGTYDDFGTSGGMEEVVIDGDEWDTYVYNHGFTYHPDMDPVDSVGRQRRYVEEMFHYFFDINFFLGMDTDNDGTNEVPGMFDWLRTNIPSSRTFDCENFDGDSGDTADYSNIPEKLIADEVQSQIEGRILDFNEGWDLMVGAPQAVRQFLQFSGETDGSELGPRYFDRLQGANLINNFTFMPLRMQPDSLPESAKSELPDMMYLDVVDEGTAVNPSGTSPLGYDEVFLIPDMSRWKDEFVDLREMGSPQVYGPVDQRGGKEAYDYKNRFGLKWDPFGEHPNATECVHLTNVSVLFE